MANESTTPNPISHHKDEKWQDKNQESEKTTTIGVKLIFVFITALISFIPLFAVDSILNMRDRYAAGVIRSLEHSLGGEQMVTGPIIMVPTRHSERKIQEIKLKYEALADGRGNIEANDISSPAAYFTPRSLAVNMTLDTQRHKQSLYYAIGYDATLDVEAEFSSLTDEAAKFDLARKGDIVFEWERTQLIFLISDSASIKIRPQAKINNELVPLAPGLPDGAANLGAKGNVGSRVQGFSAPIGSLFDAESDISLETVLAFGGATTLTVKPLGLQSNFQLTANTAPTGLHGFSGEPNPTYTPEAGKPYQNAWTTVGPYRSALAAPFRQDLLSDLLARQNFVIEYDAKNIRPYADIKQALRYGFFLMGFSFLTFFVFDALSTRYIHSAQYFLLGLIHTVFYALLLGIAEFTGFDRGFFLAAAPAVLVTSIAVASILRSFSMGVMSLVIFAAFYAVQYILMDMAEYSLLVAAGAGFLAIAASLIATARLNWGRLSKPKPT